MPSFIKYSNSCFAAFNFSGVSRRGLLATGGPFVSMWWVVNVEGWSGGAPDLLKSVISMYRWSRSAQGDIWSNVLIDVLMLGAVRKPFTNNVVVPSMRRLFVISTSKLCLRRKSDPIIGCWTSAYTNRCSNGLRMPKLRLFLAKPYVWIRVPLAANNCGSGSLGSDVYSWLQLACCERGRTDMSAPVSIKYACRVYRSETIKRFIWICETLNKCDCWIGDDSPDFEEVMWGGESSDVDCYCCLGCTVEKSHGGSHLRACVPKLRWYQHVGCRLLAGVWSRCWLLARLELRW